MPKLFASSKGIFTTKRPKIAGQNKTITTFSALTIHVYVWKVLVLLCVPIIHDFLIRFSERVLPKKKKHATKIYKHTWEMLVWNIYYALNVHNFRNLFKRFFHFNELCVFVACVCFLLYSEGNKKKKHTSKRFENAHTFKASLHVWRWHFPRDSYEKCAFSFNIFGRNKLKNDIHYFNSKINGWFQWYIQRWSIKWMN